MAAVTLVDISVARDDVAYVFNRVKEEYGFTPNILKALANCPELLVTFVPFWECVFRSPTIGPRMRAIAALATARAQECQYCVAHMSLSALRSGMSMAELTGIWPNAHLSDKENLIVEFADVLTRNSSGVSEHMLSRLKASFSDAELVNITIVVGIYNLTSRVLKALNIEIDDEVKAGFREQ